MLSAVTLLPCRSPWCKSEPEICETLAGRFWGYCHGCSASTPVVDTPEEAAALWNGNRALESAVLLAARKLREAIPGELVQPSFIVQCIPLEEARLRELLAAVDELVAEGRE